MAKWESIEDILTPEGAAKLEVGQVLGFMYEGSRTDLKVMRKRHGKVWAKRITTHLPEEVVVTETDAQGNETTQLLNQYEEL